MDVNLSGQVPLPQNTQQNSSSAQNNATTQAGATSTLQNVPDQVVTAATENTEANVREEDAFRRQERSTREQGVSQLQELQLEGVQTRVAFDSESDRVFLELLRPNTEEVIQRIPSENLIQFLQSQVEQRPGVSASDSQALDQSI